MMRLHDVHRGALPIDESAMFLSLLTGIGLSASSGLNAFLPLLIIGLIDRIRDGEVLSEPYAFLSSLPGIVVLLILVTIELLVDKSPYYRINDVFQGVLRPASGALAFMAGTSETEVNTVVALIAGLVIAGLVHVAKGGLRLRLDPRIRRAIVPMVSLIEDLYVAALAPIALLLPAVVPFALLPLLGAIGWTMRRKPQADLPVRPAEASEPTAGPTTPA